MKKFAVAALFAFAAAAASAAPVTVTYSETTSPLALHGSFTGTDANNDGLLTLDELSAWTISYDHGNFEFLNAIGTFNYKNNTWAHDAFNWDGATRNAWMTWNNWGYSVTTTNFDWQFVTTVEGGGSDVPEPASLALMGISLAALGAIRRKKQG